MIDDTLWSIVDAIRSTRRVHDIVSQSTWMWAVLESLHFIGLSVLIGSDRGVRPPAPRLCEAGSQSVALHRLIPLGIAAFALNCDDGHLLFCLEFPNQSIYNWAFRVKMAGLVLLAGVNVLFFYMPGVPPPGGPGVLTEPPPLAARIVGGVSLSCWIGVMCAGRLLTFFRPPYV